MSAAPIISFLVLFSVITGFGQGYLFYQNAGERDVYVFMPDPSDPTVAKQGGRIVDYLGFSRVDGPGYYAELWWAPGDGLDEEGLKVVPESLVTFSSGINAGLIKGRSKLDIPGTFGGDRVTLQLRVWENFAQTVRTWEDALTVGSIHGKSNLFVLQLTGWDINGNPILGNSSLRHGLRFFSLIIPEPSIGALLGLGLGVWGLSRRGKTASASSPH